MAIFLMVGNHHLRWKKKKKKRKKRERMNLGIKLKAMVRNKLKSVAGAHSRWDAWHIHTLVHT